jgi:hypothetical protein
MHVSDIVVMKGKVKHSITLDPGVWIFDDRKIKVEEFFITREAEEDPQQAYKESMGRQWDKELQEGSAPPKPAKELFVHKKDISGDWGVPFAPFLNNAGPLPEASEVTCHLQSGESIKISLEDASKSLLCFALDGRPIREEGGGPIHLLFADGSNRQDPITHIALFELV